MLGYKIGDKVKIVDENIVGIVISIGNDYVTILNEFGFEETYHPKEILAYQKLSELELIKNYEPEKLPKREKVNSSHSEEFNLLEIDLHIGQLVDKIKGLTKHQMLQIQIKKIKESIILAREKKYKTVIFIHGKGKGILKTELYKILEQENGIIYFDASFQKYRMGATEIRFQ